MPPKPPKLPRTITVTDPEALVAILTSFVAHAAALSLRYGKKATTNSWATGENIARLDDAVFAGRRALTRLAN